MDKLYSISKTSEILGVSLKTLRVWDKNDKLKPILTSGGHRRYRESDINAFIGESENNDIDLSQIIYSLQLEDFSKTLEQIEKKIFYKYKMYNNAYARSYVRNVSIYNNELTISDNKLYEYMMDDKLLVLIYSKRNDFNTIDLYITDYNIKLDEKYLK